MLGRPAFSALKSCQARQVHGEAHRLPGDERRILHEQLGLVRPARHVERRWLARRFLRHGRRTSPSKAISRNSR